MGDQVKILLLFEERKKIVILPNAVQLSEEGFLSYITKKAAELFGLASRGTIIVQYYDKDFDEWIDIEDQYLPADKEKLKILDTASLHTAAGDVSLSSLVSLNNYNHNKL